MKRRLVGKRREHDRNITLAYLAVRNRDDVLLDKVIDDHINRVLDAADGNLSLSADLLGMHRRSLQRYASRRGLRARRRSGGN